MLRDRDDPCLDRSDPWRKYKTAVIAVYHDNGANDSGRKSPGCLIYAVEFIILIGIFDIERIRECISEEMACS